MNFNICLFFRRAQNSPNDSEYYSNYSIIDKIKGFYGKKDKLIIVHEKEDENINEKIKKDDELLKNENIYVKSSSFVDDKKGEEEIYETINDYYQIPAETSKDDSKIITKEMNEMNTPEHLIYSTPTNKVLSNDDRKIFLEQQQHNSTESS